jgi:hypothetical protein
MVGEKVFEVSIRRVSDFPDAVRKMVYAEVAKDKGKFSNFKGFAKITYVTASPKAIRSIEPINGTVTEYFEAYQKDNNVDFNVF